MENANKALIMAGSTLIAIMLLTLFTYFMSKLSVWPQTQDILEKNEQISAFNAEYEVYQKSAMYGVDVVSCLNKAKSNNEKYVKGENFLGQAGYGKYYEIDVIVTIKKPLEESIEVTAMQEKGYNGLLKEVVIYLPEEDNNGSIVYKDVDKTETKKIGEVFNIGSNKMTTFVASNDLHYQMIRQKSTEFKTGEKYSLLNDNILKELLNHSNEPKQIVKNDDKNNYIYKYDSSNSIENKFGWVTATWTTYLYSFKKKRFTCKKLEYSNETGLVNKIEFEEL